MTALDIHSIYSPWSLLLSFPLIITRATYGGTESRFTDGSVVVLVVVFFSSRAFAIGCARTQFSDPQSNFFCQLGVVALAGSLSCYRKSNILNYLIGNVASKYLVLV